MDRETLWELKNNVKKSMVAEIIMKIHIMQVWIGALDESTDMDGISPEYLGDLVIVKNARDFQSTWLIESFGRRKWNRTDRK